MKATKEQELNAQRLSTEALRSKLAKTEADLRAAEARIQTLTEALNRQDERTNAAARDHYHRVATLKRIAQYAIEQVAHADGNGDRIIPFPLPMRHSADVRDDMRNFARGG